MRANPLAQRSHAKPASLVHVLSCANAGNWLPWRNMLNNCTTYYNSTAAREPCVVQLSLSHAARCDANSLSHAARCGANCPASLPEFGAREGCLFDFQESVGTHSSSGQKFVCR